MVALKLEGPIPDDELLGKASAFAKDAAEREVFFPIYIYIYIYIYKLEEPIPDDELLGKASAFAKDAAEREVFPRNC